jgi:hypothetical protein
LRKYQNRDEHTIMTTSGIATPRPAFASVERPEEGEGGTVCVGALPVVVGVGIDFVFSLPVAAVDVAEACISDVVVVSCCEEPKSL